MPINDCESFLARRKIPAGGDGGGIIEVKDLLRWPFRWGARNLCARITVTIVADLFNFPDETKLADSLSADVELPILPDPLADFSEWPAARPHRLDLLSKRLELADIRSLMNREFHIMECAIPIASPNCQIPDKRMSVRSPNIAGHRADGVCDASRNLAKHGTSRLLILFLPKRFSA